MDSVDMWFRDLDIEKGGDQEPVKLLAMNMERDRENRLEGERIFSRMDERRSKNRNRLEEENAMDWLYFEK